MKNNAFKLRIILPGIAIIFSTFNFSCKKDKTEVTDQLTILTAKKWKRVSKDTNPDSNPKTPFIYNATLACNLDDTFEFTRDGKYIFQGGDEKCDPSEDKTYTTNYAVDFTKMELSQFGYNLAILELTATRLKLAETLPPPNGQVIYLFEH